MPDNRPLGIFDSGIGGLTVANAIQNALPGENLIYFGDTAHLPYGEKSPASIKSYSLRISEFLHSRKCKSIVIACNTASSVAYEAVKKKFGDQVIVLDVINPVAREVAKSNVKRVGVIATKATIKSDMYAKIIRELNPSIEVASLATPLLVPMIEEGFYNNHISQTVIESYLNNPKLKDIDSLILACTHFPLIRPEIESFYKGSVKIVDSAEIVARELKALLSEQNLLHDGKAGEHEFYVSDFTQSFEQSTRIFFKGNINLKQHDLWSDQGL
jgi:glutamate racemase